MAMTTPVKRKRGRPRKQAPTPPATPTAEDLTDTTGTATAYTMDALMDATRTYMRILEQYPQRVQQAAVMLPGSHTGLACR